MVARKGKEGLFASAGGLGFKALGVVGKPPAVVLPER